MVRLQKTQSAKQTRTPANYTFLFYPHSRLFFSLISREDGREGAGWGEGGGKKREKETSTQDTHINWLPPVWTSAMEPLTEV